jgi:hypothetical protein
MKLCGVLTLVLVCAAGAVVQAQEAAKNAPNPLAPIAWVVGDWHATAQPPDGKPVQIDSHIYWSETRTAIFFVTRFDGQPHYSGMYAYDTARKQIAFWYVDSDGNFTQGVARTEGRRMVQEFTGTKTDGTAQSLRSYLDPAADGKSYHWQVLRGDDPRPLIQLDYTRKE